LAQAAPAAKAPQSAPLLMQVFPFILMFIALYFVMIRPQSKKSKEHAALLKAIKAGDKIVTSSGIIGIIVSVKENSVTMRSADTKLEVLKSAVTDITERSGEAAVIEA
jgi:preprotein translocase subunit YajC